MQKARFRAHATTISYLEYISSRRLILTASQDCTLALWNLEGKKMGTFGEPAGWLLGRSSHRFEKQLDEAAFEADSAEEEPPEEKKLSFREKRTPGPGTPGKLNISERLKMDSPLRMMPSPVFGQKRILPSPIVPPHGSFFMTQGGQQPENSEESCGSVSEEIPEENVDPSRNDSIISEHSDSASEVEDTGDIVSGAVDTLETKQNLLLRMDINEIVERGLAMRDRGERFFEAGTREVPAYQRMIVRDLAPYTLPDKIAKRLKGGKVKAKQTDHREMLQSAESELLSLYSIDTARQPAAPP